MMTVAETASSPVRRTTAERAPSGIGHPAEAVALRPAGAVWSGTSAVHAVRHRPNGVRTR